MTKHLLGTFFLVITLFTQVARSQDFTIAQNITGNNRTDIRGQLFKPSAQGDGTGTITTSSSVYLTSFNVVYTGGTQAPTLYIYSCSPSSTDDLDNGTMPCLIGESTAKIDGVFPYTSYLFDYLELDVNGYYTALFRQDVQLEFGSSGTVEGPYDGGLTYINDGTSVIQNEYTDLKFVGEFLESIPPHQGDVDALIALYNSTDGANWTTTWDLNGDPYEWHGLVWNNGRVVRISMFGNRANGELPDEIGNFTELTRLTISVSTTAVAISGKLPASIGNLTKLESLHIFGADFESIPSEIANLSNLTNLLLSNSSLSGDIPEGIFELTNLRELDLGGNSFSGNIPDQISKLENLTVLELGNNDLSGSLPLGLFQLPNLRRLRLQSNNLTGNISAEIENLTQLQDLNLFSNEFEGELPSTIGNLHNLLELRLHANKFEGSIPTQIGNLSNLTLLHINQNVLTSLPAEINLLSNLESLIISDNPISELPLITLDKLIDFRTNESNLTFESLEPNFHLFNFLSDYSPQRTATISETKIIKKIGESLILNVDVGGSSNLYEWFKDGERVGDIMNVGEINFGTFMPEDTGIYTCEVSNSVVTDLVLETADISVIQQIQFKTIPLVAIIGGTQIVTKVETDKNCSVYYIALTQDSATPSLEQLLAGTDANDNPVISGSSEIVVEVLTEVTINGLDDQTAYDIYLIAQDEDDLTTEVVKLSVETVIMGLDNTFKEGELSIYPNPVTDQLFVDFNITDSYNLSILTLKGQEIFSKSTLKNSYLIDVGNLDHGIYLLKVETKDQIGWARFIKQ